MAENNQLENIRHSLAHLLAAAVLKKFPDAKLGIGPTIDDGFYYDFLLPETISEKDLKEFEKTMRKLISQKLEFSGEKLTADEAKKIFAGQQFKLELIEDFEKENKELTYYKTGDVFADLCRGGHVKNTSEIAQDAFKLARIAGAYWKGSEKNAQLTRIYGLAYASKAELDSRLSALEEAKKRDHKKLGPELDLFTFSELVGSGLPLWTPKGTLLRDILDGFVWELRKAKGYERVDIPHITKKELYETSGHWDKFKDELFKITTREGHVFAMKPMNCPHHTQIYARRQWSYRELPQRYASTTKVYRDEQTGELSGLSRVRAITQDDAHVFARPSQVKSEIEKIWEIIHVFYERAGFKLKVRLSLSDPAQQKNYLGTREIWDKSENELREILKAKGVSAVEAIGEAAFYGPKIDFMAKDSLGREWQVATIQLDMNLPERFDLYCINESGEKERIVMIHAAIMGSIERYLSILIEHFAGAFPFWLSPVQIQVLTINDKVLSYAEDVTEKLKSNRPEAGQPWAGNIRVSLDERNESIGKKIREAEMQKIPYILVIGEKEAEAGKVAVRERGKGDIGVMSVEEFLKITVK
ncbi:MAG: threonine--tRNA ligase [bacterium]|nr:threonine--tRNA ligase [bacterium]